MEKSVIIISFISLFLIIGGYLVFTAKDKSNTSVSSSPSSLKDEISPTFTKPTHPPSPTGSSMTL